MFEPNPRRIPPEAVDLWADAVCEVLGTDDFPIDMPLMTPEQNEKVLRRYLQLTAKHGLSAAEIFDPIGASRRADQALIEEHNLLHPSEPITDADIAERAPDLLGPRNE